MKRRVLATCVASLALAALAAEAATAAGTTRISAGLNASQEVPAPDGAVSGARGTFAGSVTGGANPRLTYTLSFSGLTGDAVQAHVHLGKPGVAGPVAVALCGPCTSGTKASVEIDKSVRAALLNGTAYVNVHTAANPAGEVRGQVGVLVSATLGARQEVPAPAGAADARGSFTGRLIGSKISWSLTFRDLTGPALQAHIHLGAPGKAGAVAVSLCGPCRAGSRGTATLAAPKLAALRAGRSYVNVHTRANPAGEIRGQLKVG